jgi:acetylornithine deacetylase/succinyl-diaminopimelate desuccinylase-like protein
VDFPIVYGRFDVGAPRTMVMHSMYDTTPADEPTWVVPPFEARRVGGYENLGECIVGRGARTHKGPVATLMNAVAAYRAANVPLPCNIIMLFEASELGSKSLPAFVDAHADELRGADVCFWPWYTQKSDGTNVVFLRVKGLMTLKLRCKGGEWGGPQNAEIHGAHSTWISNPAHRLAACPCEHENRRRSRCRDRGILRWSQHANSGGRRTSRQAGWLVSMPSVR